MKYSDSSKVVLFGHITKLLLLFVKTFECGDGNFKLPKKLEIKTWLRELSSVDKEIEQAPSEPKTTSWYSYWLCWTKRYNSFNEFQKNIFGSTYFSS